MFDKFKDNRYLWEVVKDNYKVKELWEKLQSVYEDKKEITSVSMYHPSTEYNYEVNYLHQLLNESFIVINNHEEDPYILYFKELRIDTQRRLYAAFETKEQPFPLQFIYYEDLDLIPEKLTDMNTLSASRYIEKRVRLAVTQLYRERRLAIRKEIADITNVYLKKVKDYYVETDRLCQEMKKECLKMTGVWQSVDAVKLSQHRWYHKFFDLFKR